MDGTSAPEPRPTIVVFNCGLQQDEAVFRLAVTGRVKHGHYDREDAGNIGSFFGYARQCFHQAVFRGPTPGRLLPPRDYITEKQNTTVRAVPVSPLTNLTDQILAISLL